MPFRSHRRRVRLATLARRRRAGAVRALFALLLAVVLLAGLGWWAWDTYAAARATQQHLAALQALAQAGHPPNQEQALQAVAEVAGLRDGLERVHADLAPLRAPLAAVAEHSAQARRLDMAARTLDLSVELVAAADDLGRAAMPLLTPGAEGPAGARLGGAADRAAPLLVSAHDHLERATTLRAAIDRFALQGRLAQLGSGLDQVDRFLPATDELVGELAAVAPAVPDLLGMRGPRAYLVLGQNERETRPTGGFIGSLGRLVIDRGGIAAAAFQSSYAFDNPGREAVRPPQELARFMNAGAWFVRDANWWADFRTSAAQVERFWEADQGSPVDGVIAVDEAAVAALIDAVGPIDVPELGRAVSGQEFFTLARERMGQPTPGGYQQEKSRILGQAMLGLMTRLPSASGEQQAQIARALLAALRDRHVLVAVHEPRLAAFLHARGWDGALVGGPHDDYFALVDSSLAYSEAGAYVQRSLAYRVELDAWGRVTRATLDVTYRNTYDASRASPGERHAVGGVYWDPARQAFVQEEGVWGDLVRLYVPKGTRLLALDGLDYPPRYTLEGGKSVLGGYFLIRPGQARALRFEYVPPVTPAEPDSTHIYRLVAQPQPGVAPYTLDVEARVQGRDALRAAGPGAQPSGGGVARWRASLQGPATFELALPEHCCGA